MPCTPGVSPRSVPVVTSPAPRSAIVRVPTSAPLASRSDATTLPDGAFSGALGSLPAGTDCEQAATRRRAAMVDGRKRMVDLVSVGVARRDDRPQTAGSTPRLGRGA